jgi:hypothetical protein
MSAEEPETEGGAANDATEVVDDDRLREAAGGQAWSDADDDADDDGPESHPWSVVTGHAAALISVGAAVAAITVVVGWMMLHKDRPAPSPATEKSTSSAAAPAPPPPSPVQATPPPSPVPAPPPPSTVTVQAAPPNTGLPTPGPSVYDQNFISLMAQEGWGCAGSGTSPLDNEQCRKEMVSFAHQICSYSGQPISLIYQNFGLPSFFGPREERRAIANAQQAYPNCTFTGNY